jgi:hypothetical protein
LFESSERLGREIFTLLEGLRLEAGGRYACLVDARRLLFESHAEDEDLEPLRELLEGRRGELFALPRQLATEEPMEDVFEGWEKDDFFLAFINGRVALVLACPEAEPLREHLMRPLKILADRLFRLDSSYRLDEQGRGLFFGAARLDLVVVGRDGARGSALE